MTVLKPALWPKWAQWSAIPAALVFVVLLGNTVDAFAKLDPVLPATRGYVQQVKDLITSDQRLQVAQASQHVADQYQAISRDLGQLSGTVQMMRVESLDDKLSQLQYQRVTLEDLAETSGNDPRLRALVMDHDRQIGEIERRLKRVRCKMEDPDRANC